MNGRVLSEEELQRKEQVLQNNVEILGMQTDQDTADLIATIRDRDKQLAAQNRITQRWREQAWDFEHMNQILNEELEKRDERISYLEAYADNYSSAHAKLLGKAEELEEEIRDRDEMITELHQSRDMWFDNAHTQAGLVAERDQTIETLEHYAHDVRVMENYRKLFENEKKQNRLMLEALEEAKQISDEWMEHPFRQSYILMADIPVKLNQILSEAVAKVKEGDID